MLNLFRKKKAEITDAERKEQLRKNGRITDGIIIETATATDGREVVYFTYTLNGVDFESSEILTKEQASDPLRFAAGQKVSIRYDQKNQGNSTLG
jgi:hypothetical protein